MKKESKNLAERVLKTIRNYSMVKPGDAVLAAVSGGPDSVFLLRTLNDLKRKLKMARLAVCNLDHGLRGEESRADSVFVKRLSEELGLEFFQKKTDLAGSKSKELSPEERSREVRYKFFKEAAAGSKAAVIATGHTLDDQAETVLMRIIKGSSLRGIVGISPVREEGKITFIRPLIELEKREITACLDGAGLPYRIDRTNSEDRYFRNTVRGKIIPFLEQYNPRLKRSLFSLAEHLREDFEFIKDKKGEFQKNISETRKGAVELNLKDIIVQPAAMQKEILRDSLEKAGGLVKKLSFRHWKELENLIKFKRKGNSVDLPGSIRATRTDRALVFYRRLP